MLAHGNGGVPSCRQETCKGSLMEVHALPSAAGRAAGPLWRHAPRLIELCGTPRFEEALFEAARETATCEHVTAFAFTSSTEPRILVAANTSARPVARQVGRKYVRDYWTFDPARKAETAHAAKAGPFAIRILADDIECGPYRQDCYTAVGLNDRISLVGTRNGETLRLNFYKSLRNGRFEGEEISHIFGAAELLMSLLAKHDAAMPVHGDDEAARFRRRLQMFAKPLPRRELEVCTLIAAGMSSEGIGLELGISLNTVLTHRKRAYARLGISSQNELLRLLLS